ncbi:matrix metalloproteinase-19-like [Tubulanus polymorphus]|uniref:matrix metalloproteinase-19-like n=1 Tax=Tubulanus polymorphus TaxID=672921 RepID=UPI003DA50299
MHVVVITVAAIAFLGLETSGLLKRSVNPDEYLEKGRPVPIIARQPMLPPTHPPTSGPCRGAYEAIINTPDGLTYAFTPYKAYIMTTRGVDSQAVISALFFPEPRNVITAATYSPRTKKVYLFAGTQLFRYEYKTAERRFYLDEGYPIDYQRRSDYPRYPDAAFVDNGGWTNIIEGNKIWFFDEINMGSRRNTVYDLNSFFPKAPPGRIDAAAFRGNAYYLFQGQYYYYTSANREPMVGPIMKDQRWMGC